MLDDLLETWQAHNAINLNLLNDLPEGRLELTQKQEEHD
jgi:hypothetical protein